MLVVLVVLFLSLISSRADIYNVGKEEFAVLNYKNVISTITGSKTAWVVQFYNSWCGHCKAYAPEWRKFVHRIKDWEHTIKAAGIDCAADENVDICRNFDFKFFPTLKIFGPGYQMNETSVLVRNRKADLLMLQITDFVLDLQARNKLPNKRLDFTYYKGPIGEIFNVAPSDSKFAILIKLHDKFKFGWVTLLDLGNYPSVYVRRALMDGETAQLIILKRDGKQNTIELTGILNATVLTDRIKSELSDLVNISEKVDRDHVKPTVKITELPTTPALVIIDQSKVYMVDMENALSYALRHEVALHKALSEEHLNALKDFLSILVKYFPARPQVHNFLVQLYELLAKAGPSMSYEKYGFALEFITSNYSLLPEERPWMGCMGSTPSYRGYTCGLWSLFHTLTVNAYSRGLNEVMYGPHETIRAIHGYVKYFFSCGHCSKNFQQMYKLDAESLVKIPGDEIGWLWYAHNKVNKRLSGDVTEDPKHPKIQFPSKSICPQCRKDGDTRFNEKESLKYLIMRYKSESISMKGTQPLPLLNTNIALPGIRSISTKGLPSTITTSTFQRSKSFVNEISNLPDIEFCFLVYMAMFVTVGGLMWILRSRSRWRYKEYSNLV